MDKNFTIEDGVKSLFRVNGISDMPKWEYLPKTEKDYTERIIIDGEIYPIFYWRHDPQIQAIMRNGKYNIGGSCSTKISGMIDRTYGLQAFLYKEIDNAEWILDSKIKKMTAFVNQNAANVLLKMENDKVAVLELGANLPKGTEEQTRHTVWGKMGMESTRVVSTKIRPQSVYLYTDKPEPYTFNDATIELYGLSLYDATIAVSIFKMLTDKVDLAWLKSRERQLIAYINNVYASSDNAQSIIFEEAVE